MTADDRLILYTRPGCHLCERVAAMLDELAYDWEPVDIESDPDLADRYGLLIPVVFSESAKKELPFPFGTGQLSRFVEEIRKV